MHYFGRSPEELNAIESVFLIKMLPSPISRHRIYEKGEVTPRQMALFHRVLKTMHERKRLNDGELAAALSQEIVFHREGTPLPPPRSPLNRPLSTLDDLTDDALPPPDEEPLMMQEL